MINIFLWIAFDVETYLKHLKMIKYDMFPWNELKDLKILQHFERNQAESKYNGNQLKSRNNKCEKGFCK